MKRQTTCIKKGDNGWHAICVLPTEYRDMDTKKIEDHLSVKEGRWFYDFRIDPKTWYIWLKQKEANQVNIVTSRDEQL